MEELHAEFHRRGATHAFLEVSVNNLVARRFYERLGYRFVELLPGYYGDGTDACLMIRPATGAGPGTDR
jgi:ribosomal-protein-alanine N-acetyltransferase